MGGAVTTVLYGVTEQQIPPCEELRPLLRLWEEARGARRLPMRADLPPDRLKPWLGHLTLLAPVDDGADFVYRIHGSFIAGELHNDFTGKRLMELPDGFGRTHAPILRKTMRAETPTLLLFDPPMSYSLITRVNLVMPLGGPEEEGTQWLLIAGYPHTILGDARTAEALSLYANMASAWS